MYIQQENDGKMTGWKWLPIQLPYIPEKYQIIIDGITPANRVSGILLDDILIQPCAKLCMFCSSIQCIFS